MAEKSVSKKKNGEEYGEEYGLDHVKTLNVWKKDADVAGIRFSTELNATTDGAQISGAIAGLKIDKYIKGDGDFTLLKIGPARIDININNYLSKGRRICFGYVIKYCIWRCFPWWGCYRQCYRTIIGWYCIEIPLFVPGEFDKLNELEQVQHLQHLSASFNDGGEPGCNCK